MPHRITLRTLRTAHCVLRGSFLTYLAHAKPYIGPDGEAQRGLLDDLIERQDRLAQKIAGKIRDLGDAEDLCDFPAEFTDAHDLSVAYALKRSAEHAGEDLRRLEQLRDELIDPEAGELLDEVLHEERAILGQLEKATVPAPTA